MVEIQTLFVHPGCPHCWKILLVSEFIGKTDKLEFLTWEQTKSPEYLAKNPNGKVPAALTSNGIIYESHAIMRALARAHPDKKLYGKNNFESGKVDQWLDWLSGELVPTFYTTHGAISGFKPGDEKSYAEGLENLKKKLQILEDHLANNQFIVGDSVTIADLSLVATARGPAATVFDAELRKQFPNFFNYFQTLAGLEQVVKALGKIRFTEKRWPLYVPPAPKKEEKKAAEKPASKPKKKDDDEEEEEVEAPKKDEAKIEIESLPHSPFNFYDFKTLITNAPNKKEAVDQFWNLFDKDGYSLWFVEYEKAPGEGKVVYLTNNLMNGFLQRLDHFRKYCYGVYGVYGDEPNLEVRGVFCWRGNFIPLLVKQHDQYDYHRFTQLDPTKEADRKKVEEFWTKLNEDEDVVDGLTARTVKLFK